MGPRLRGDDTATLRSRGVAERGDDMVDHFLDQDAVVALAHHADHRFGAGGADQQPAMAVEALLALKNRRLDLGGIERLAAAVADVFQDLRQWIEAPAHFRDRAAQFLDHREHLQRRDETVAGGRIVGQDDMAGRLAADIIALRQHLLEHVAVADRRAYQFNAETFEETLQSEIGHHGRDHARLRQPAVFLPALRDHREQLIAVDHVAALVDQDDAVGVAIERDADVGTHFAHLAAQRLRRGGAAILVDVESVRLDADGDNVGAQLPKRFRHHLVRGAMGTIDHHAQAVEAEIARQRALGKFDIAVVHAVDAAGAPEACALRELTVQILVEQLLDLLFDVVRQLEAERPEQFYAVVLEQI